MDVTAYGVCLLPSTYGMVLGFTQSIYKRVSLKRVVSIVVDRDSLLPFNPTYVAIKCQHALAT